jgi:hypothetical protein
MLQFIGYHGDASTMVWRGDPAGPDWAACWLEDGRLVALLTVDRPRDLVQGRRVIAAGATVDVARLTDPAVPIRDVVTSP